MSELEEIDKRLWNIAADSEQIKSDVIQNQILEQYKIYLEMADRISQRRGVANTFFLTFNTAIVGALVTFFGKITQYAGIAFFIASMLFCIAWWLLLRSYRNLNTAKFKVVGLLEKRLPSSPFWAAEWKALGEGKDYSKYIPLSAIETLVPTGFFFVYLYLILITIHDNVGKSV